MTGGFRNVMGWILGWRSAPSQPKTWYVIARIVSSTGPAAGQISMAGAVVGQTYRSGAIAGGVV